MGTAHPAIAMQRRALCPTVGQAKETGSITPVSKIYKVNSLANPVAGIMENYRNP